MTRDTVYTGDRRIIGALNEDRQQETQEINDSRYEDKQEGMYEEQGEDILDDTYYSSEDVDQQGEDVMEDTDCKSEASAPPNDINTIIATKKFDLSDLQKPNTKAHPMRKIVKADFAVVNTPGNGKRVKYSKDCLEKLGIQSIDGGTIDIAFGPFGIVSAKDLSGSGQTFSLSKGGHIYSKDLVEEITNRFKLDFTGVTTRSFNGPEYQVLDNGCTVAITNM